MNEEKTHIQIQRSPTHEFLMSAKIFMVQNQLTDKTLTQITYDDVILYCLQKAIGKDSHGV